MSSSPLPLTPVPMPPAGSDVFLKRIEAARAGELEARGEILQQCRGYLLAVAMRRMPKDLQAKIGASDLAQEALTQAHANFQRFHGESERELLAWLGQILDYSLLTVQRRYCDTDKRAIAREVPLDDRGDSSDARFDVPRDTPGPASRAAALEEQARLSAAMSQLRPADREVIELRNLQALSFAEIARRTGRTPDAVRKHWARALDRLSELLDG